MTEKSSSESSVATAVGVLSGMSLTKVFRLTEQYNRAGDHSTLSPLPTNWRDYLSTIKLSIISLSFPSVFERNTTHYSIYITTHYAIYTYSSLCCMYNYTLCYIHNYTLCYMHILCAVLYVRTTHCAVYTY